MENFDINHTIDQMLNGYLYTALWTEELDNLDVNDFDVASKHKAKSDCDLFKSKAGSLLDGLDLSAIGHNFWLTRNGHGAGFWDGDYETEVGEKLTEISKQFGEINIHNFEGDVVELF